MMELSGQMCFLADTAVDILLLLIVYLVCRQTTA